MAVDLFKISQRFNEIALTDHINEKYQQIQFKECEESHLSTPSFLFWVTMQDDIDWIDDYVLEYDGARLYFDIYEDIVTGLTVKH